MANEQDPLLDWTEFESPTIASGSPFDTPFNAEPSQETPSTLNKDPPKLCGIIQNKGAPCSAPAKHELGTCLRPTHIERAEAIKRSQGETSAELTKTTTDSAPPCLAIAGNNKQCIYPRSPGFLTCQRSEHREQDALILAKSFPPAATVAETVSRPPPLSRQAPPPGNFDNNDWSLKQQSPLDGTTEADVVPGEAKDDGDEGDQKTDPNFLLTPRMEEALKVAEKMSDMPTRIEHLETAIVEFRDQFTNHNRQIATLIKNLPKAQHFQSLDEVKRDLDGLKERPAFDDDSVTEKFKKMIITEAVSEERWKAQVKQLSNAQGLLRQDLEQKTAVWSEAIDDLKRASTDTEKQPSPAQFDPKTRDFLDKIRLSHNSFVDKMTRITADQTNRLSLLEHASNNRSNEVQMSAETIEATAVQELQSENKKLWDSVQAHGRQINDLMDHGSQKQSTIQKDIDALRKEITAMQPIVESYQALPPSKQWQVKEPVSRKAQRDMQHSKLERLVNDIAKRSESGMTTD